jgi:membrane protease YdiL (CAAX protease family)
MRIKTFARRYPVGMYFGLAFVISWVGSLLAGGAKFLQGEAIGVTDIEYLFMALAMMAGPSVSGITMTYLVDGRSGLEALFARMKKWQVAGRWYAALLIFPILILAVSLALSALVSPEFSPTFLAIGVVAGLFAGFIEETGWMGFAFPRMQLKRSILSASIYLGFLHGLWHIVADFLSNSATFGEHWLPYFAGFFVMVMALRVLIVWVYANTKSLMLAQLMHASSSGFLVMIVPTDIAPVYWSVFYRVYAVALCTAAAVVVARYGKNLVRQPEEARAV